MTSNGPERLIASADYGSGLRELKAETFSAERLAASWRGIEDGLGSPRRANSGTLPYCGVFLCSSRDHADHGIG